MRIPGRFLLAAATGLVVLVAGVIPAMVRGGFAVLERTAPPGNRLLILEFLEFIATAVLLCLPRAAACWVLLRPGSHSRRAWSPTRGGFF